MSVLPGLGLSAPTPLETVQAEPSSPREIQLSAGSEWRFEVPFESNITVRLLAVPMHVTGSSDASLSGTAEIFGSELASSHDYTFSGAKAAVFTHHGCTLHITGGPCDSDYVADETPMVTYTNLHFALENIRTAAAASRASGSPDSSGPRVLILGPDNAGKTSLAKLLATYASRAGHSPCVVNLDPREGMLCLPGSISATVLGPGSIMDVEDTASNGWGGAPVAGSSGTPVKMPLVYHYGCERPDECADVFQAVSSRLALAVQGRIMEDQAVRDAGVIVDLAGSVASGKRGYDVVSHVVTEFQITIILTIGSERLYSDMQRRYPSTPSTAPSPSHPTILKLPRSGGAVDRDAAYRAAHRHAQIRSYFFGTPAAPLSPYTSYLDTGALPFSILRMAGTDSDIAAAFLPGGSDVDSGGLGGPAGGGIFKPIAGALTAAASGTLLAIKHAGAGDAWEAVRDASVLGYLYIADVDEAKKRCKVLSPIGGRLPSRAVVWGRWPEEVGELA